MIYTSGKHKGADFKYCGQKAYHLALMKEAGFEVPEFVCITSKEDNNEKLVDILKLLCPGAKFFAVRSSSLEDSNNASFLNVSYTHLQERIQACMVGNNKDRIQTFEKENNTSQKNHENVIIQEMITPDYSGVVFTENPMGIKSEWVIVTARGFGEGMYNGSAETTTYYFNRGDKKCYWEQNGVGPLLPQYIQDKLNFVQQAMTKKFGEALKIDYAVAGEKVYLLQFQTIAALHHEKTVVLDNSGIVESYPGLTLPLTMSFISYAYGAIFKTFFYHLTGNNRVSVQYKDKLENMLGMYNGRVYYQLNHWSFVLGMLPFSERIMPVWQEKLGVKIDFPREKYVSDLSREEKICIMFRFVAWILAVPKQMNHLNQDFQNTEEMFQREYRDDMSLKEYKALFQKMNGRIMKNWDITMANDIYIFFYTAAVKKLLGWEEKGDEEVLKELVHNTNPASLKPIRGIIQLALYAGKNKLLCEAVGIAVTPNEYRRFMNLEDSRVVEFRKRFLSYVNRYGDRSAGDLKLETETYRECPWLLMRQIVAFMQMKDLKQVYYGVSTVKPEENNNVILNVLQRKMTTGMKNRELSSVNRSGIFGLSRRIFLGMGQRLMEQGELNAREDILYLTMSEIYQGKLDYKEVVSQRKKEYQYYAKLPDYKRIEFNGTIKNKPIKGNVYIQGNRESEKESQ